jgi:hypothetical protein
MKSEKQPSNVNDEEDDGIMFRDPNQKKPKPKPGQQVQTK